MTESEKEIIRRRERVRILDLQTYADAHQISFAEFDAAVSSGVSVEEWAEVLNCGQQSTRNLPPINTPMTGRPHALASYRHE